MLTRTSDSEVPSLTLICASNFLTLSRLCGSLETFGLFMPIEHIYEQSYFSFCVCVYTHTGVVYAYTYTGVCSLRWLSIARELRTSDKIHLLSTDSFIFLISDIRDEGPPLCTSRKNITHVKLHVRRHLAQESHQVVSEKAQKRATE